MGGLKKINFAPLWSPDILAQIIFFIVCVSGLCMGASIRVYSSAYPALVLLLIPFYWREMLTHLHKAALLWALALLPLAHSGAYLSPTALEKAYGILLVTACGIVLGYSLTLYQLLFNFFCSLRAVLYAAIVYSVSSLSTAFAFSGGAFLWKSFLPSANSLAVIVGALVINALTRFHELSRAHKTLVIIFLCGAGCLSRNVSLILAVSTVLFTKLQRQLTGRELFRLFLLIAGTVVVTLLFWEVNIYPLLMLHGRIPQWCHYFHYFDSYWVGLGGGNIQREPYAVEFYRRFLFKSSGLYVDNGYLNLFFDYGLVGVFLFVALIKNIVKSLDLSHECVLLKDLMIYLAVMNITGGWLLYESSPWWLMLISAASSLGANKESAKAKG
jgi:hypothetical protein